MKFRSNTNCCVPQCSAVHSKTPDCSFHLFPKDVKAKREWITLLKLGKKPSAAARVCSRHFCQSDFHSPGESQL